MTHILPEVCADDGVPGLNVLILSDGRAGHLNPCLGFFDAIRANAPHARLQQLTVKPRGKWATSLLKRLSHTPFFLPVLVRLAYKEALPAFSSPIHVVICSGMPVLPAAVMAARIRGARLFYIGNVRGFNPSLIHCVVGALPQDIPGELVLPTPPVRQAIINLQARPAAAQQPKALLLVGGATRQYPFTMGDWQDLMTHFTATCQRLGWGASVCTSRRTGAEAEALLARLTKAMNGHFYGYGQTGAPTVTELLAEHCYVYVSEDSTTMITEAIQSGRGVVSIHPPQAGADELTLKYAATGLIRRVSTTETVFPAPDSGIHNAPGVQDAIWKRVQESLQP